MTFLCKRSYGIYHLLIKKSIHSMRTLYKGILILTFSICFVGNARSQDSLRWILTNDGGIEWKV